MKRSLEEELPQGTEDMEKEDNDQEQKVPEKPEQEAQPETTIHVHYFPDAIVILNEEENDRVVDSTPVLPQKTSLLPAYVICCFYCLLIVSTLAFQLYWLINPPTVTVTIVPKSQTVTLTGTLQLGRVLPPLTISQSQTVATTGKGHQDARAATGTVTFYNGQQTAQTVAQGTVFTGRSGVSIETTQSATIPPGNPSTGYGTVTVTAQAVEAGSKGNIQAGDVNTTLALAVFVKNNQFIGGKDERDFQTVTKGNIDTTAIPLKKAVAQSLNGAFQGQLTPSEQLVMLPCHPTVTSDHQPGDEAISVTVTVSQTCSAVAYNTQELATKATDFLIHQAGTKRETDYRLLGAVQVTVSQVSVQKHVIISFSASGTWVYLLGNREQQMKRLIAGKTKHQAVQLLSSLPGIASASIAWDETAKLPKDTNLIHFILVQSG
jgi:baseplate J-like protein